MNDATISPLVDSFGRRIDYLRVSVTDRCDLRCHYCMPKDFTGFKEPAHWLTHEEMARLVGVFSRLGVTKVRLTGGEPLTRRGVEDLAARVSRFRTIRDIALSTNGTRLARHAAGLKAAGVHRVNVSLDTLDPAKFQQITGRDVLDDVLAGLAEARRVGFTPVKLNCVVHEEVPEDELDALLDFSLRGGFVLRLIETMPMGSSGQQFRPANLTRMGNAMASRFALVPTLESAGNGPARYWADAGGRPVLGVITPLSQHFCAACNRVRLGVDGTLYLCLGQEDKVPLGAMLRQGADDVELMRQIRMAIDTKPGRHEFSTAPTRIVRFMSQTGG